MSRPLLVFPFFHLVQFFPVYTMPQLHPESSILLQSHLAPLTSHIIVSTSSYVHGRPTLISEAFNPISQAEAFQTYNFWHTDSKV